MEKTDNNLKEKEFIVNFKGMTRIMAKSHEEARMKLLETKHINMKGLSTRSTADDFWHGVAINMFPLVTFGLYATYWTIALRILVKIDTFSLEAQIIALMLYLVVALKTVNLPRVVADGWERGLKDDN